MKEAISKVQKILTEKGLLMRWKWKNCGGQAETIETQTEEHINKHCFLNS